MMAFPPLREVSPHSPHTSTGKPSWQQIHQELCQWLKSQSFANSILLCLFLLFVHKIIGKSLNEPPIRCAEFLHGADDTPDART